jgi:hypothetical protein
MFSATDVDGPSYNLPKGKPMNSPKTDLKLMLEMSQRIDNGESPLSQVDPQSLDIYFERVNNKLVMGVPETISDEDDLSPMVAILRAKRLTFLQEEAKKIAAGPRRRSPKKATSVAQVIQDLSELDELDDA